MTKKANEHVTAHNRGDYAFSKHLHLHQNLGQRLLAATQASGLTITQAIYKVLDEHLPNVHVRPIHTKPAEDRPQPRKTAQKPVIEQEQSLRTSVRAWTPMRIPNIPGVNTQGLGERVAEYVRKYSAGQIVSHAIEQATRVPVGVTFTLPELFEPTSWEDFPREVRRAVRKLFLSEMLNPTDEYDEKFEVRRGAPITHYKRVK